MTSQSNASDLVERLREESMQLARRSFDSVDAGISANLCDAAIDEIERLRAQLAAAEATIATAEKMVRSDTEVKTELRSQLEAARKALEEIKDRAMGSADKVRCLRTIDRIRLIAIEALRTLTPGADK